MSKPKRPASLQALYARLRENPFGNYTFDAGPTALRLNCTIRANKGLVRLNTIPVLRLTPRTPASPALLWVTSAAGLAGDELVDQLRFILSTAAASTLPPLNSVRALYVPDVCIPHNPQNWAHLLALTGEPLHRLVDRPHHMDAPWGLRSALQRAERLFSNVQCYYDYIMGIGQEGILTRPNAAAPAGGSLLDYYHAQWLLLAPDAVPAEYMIAHCWSATSIFNAQAMERMNAVRAVLALEDVERDERVFPQSSMPAY